MSLNPNRFGSVESRFGWFGSVRFVLAGRFGTKHRTEDGRPLEKKKDKLSKQAFINFNNYSLSKGALTRRMEYSMVYSME
jgi:hypothetical protein